MSHTPPTKAPDHNLHSAPARARLRFKCFSLAPEVGERMFGPDGRALCPGAAQRSVRLEEFAGLIDDDVSLEYCVGEAIIYIPPKVCLATAALLAYKRSLEQQTPARAWIEFPLLCRLRGRSREALRRQLTTFRQALREHTQRLDPFEVRKGTVRFNSDAVEFYTS